MNRLDYNTAPKRERFLSENELHLWRIDLDTSRGFRRNDTLSADEVKRAQTFRRSSDVGRYVAARAGLRDILSLYLNIRPEDVRFSYNEHGKPELDRKVHRETIHFNLSRSGNIAIIAVSGHGSVGVDIEFIDPDFPYLSVAEKYFPPTTLKELRQLPPDSARSMFFDLWTGIEAYGKGKGAGLSDSIYLDYLTPATKTIGDHPAEHLQRREDWSITNIFAGHNYTAAVATAGPVSCFRYWQVLPEQRPAECSENRSITASNFLSQY